MADRLRTTVRALGELFDGPHATPVRREEGPYFLNISSLKSGRLDLTESDHLSAEDFTKWTRRVTPGENDLLFSYETRLGEAALMPAGVEACLGRRMALLRPDLSVVNARFLLYFYLSPSFQRTIQKHMIHGATVPRIGLATMPDWVVVIPQLSEQKAIAEVLGALDDKIVVNERAARTMDQLIATHYAAAIAGPDVSTQPLFEVIDVVFGEAFKGDNFTDRGKGRPLIRIRDLKTADPQVWTSEVRPKETLIQPGDVVVGMDAEFRATWWLGDPGLLNQRVLRATARFASTAFAVEALRRPLAALEGEKSATTVTHLNKSDLERTSVEVPGVDALARFDAIAEPLRLARVTLALESRKLAAARDELLPLLMSGKVEVKDAETSVEGVL